MLGDPVAQIAEPLDVPRSSEFNNAAATVDPVATGARSRTDNGAGPTASIRPSITSGTTTSDGDEWGAQTGLAR
jgi:hypothetical protein